METLRVIVVWFGEFNSGVIENIANQIDNIRKNTINTQKTKFEYCLITNLETLEKSWKFTPVESSNAESSYCWPFFRKKNTVADEETEMSKEMSKNLINNIIKKSLNQKGLDKIIKVYTIKLLCDHLKKELKSTKNNLLPENIKKIIDFHTKYPIAKPNYAAASDIARILALTCFGGVYIDLDRNDWANYKRSSPNKEDFLLKASEIKQTDTLLIAGMSGYNPDCMWFKYEPNKYKYATQQTHEAVKKLKTDKTLHDNTVKLFGEDFKGGTKTPKGETKTPEEYYRNVNNDIIGLSPLSQAQIEKHELHPLGCKILFNLMRNTINYIVEDGYENVEDGHTKSLGTVFLNTGNEPVTRCSIVRDPIGQYRSTVHMAGPGFYMHLMSEKEKRSEFSEIIWIGSGTFPKARHAITSISENEKKYIVNGNPFTKDLNLALGEGYLTKKKISSIDNSFFTNIFNPSEEDSQIKIEREPIESAILDILIKAKYLDEKTNKVTSKFKKLVDETLLEDKTLKDNTVEEELKNVIKLILTKFSINISYEEKFLALFKGENAKTLFRLAFKETWVENVKDSETLAPYCWRKGPYLSEYYLRTMVYGWVNYEARPDDSDFTALKTLAKELSPPSVPLNVEFTFSDIKQR